ncbi:MAG: hypothetical protein HRU70_00920 [Phycisphaeraceae bacterium]|nr:MAG: hypothetical protein HRU70_00920 [Phycisphaeraceae bacterium]
MNEQHMTVAHSRSSHGPIRRLVFVCGLAVALGAVEHGAAFAQDRAVPVPGTVQQPGRMNQDRVRPGRTATTPTVPAPGRAQPATGGRTDPRGGNAPVMGGGGAGGGGGGEGERHEVPRIEAGDDEIEFSGFSEAVELTTLVEILASTLQINVWVDPELSGSVVFNAPVRVSRDGLMPLIESMLEMYGYTITRDAKTGWYKVHKIAGLAFELAGEASRTKLFETPGIKPSALKPTIDSVLGSGGPSGPTGQAGRNVPQVMPQQPGMPGGDGGGVVSGTLSGGGRVAYNDELGLIVVTNTERELERFEMLLRALLERHAEIDVHTIPLTYIAPSVARQRILELFGQAAPAAGGQAGGRGGMAFDEYGNPRPQGQQAQAARTTLDNIGERLITDPNGNNLFFRGNASETERVMKVVAIIDQRTNLVPESYYAGAAAKQIADIAKQRGLGEVTAIQSLQEQAMRPGFGFYDYNARQPQQQQQTLAGGPVMVVDEGRGNIIYYATASQHAEFAALIEVLKPEDDAVVIRAYRLVNGDAEKVAPIIMGLINNQSPAGGQADDRLPGGGGGGFGMNQTPNIVFQGDPFGMMARNELALSGRNTFALADKNNNQVLLKAPLKEHPVFAELIRKLDSPRAQVFVEAKIVSVSASDTFRLGFETQLINAGGTGGAFNTNFGLGAFATGADLRGVKTAPPISGGTFAIIKSDQVPVIINALQTVTDARVLASPQIMVEAGEEGTIDAKDEQPTQQRIISDNSSVDVVNPEYVEAGTKLAIKKPIIGSANSVKMQVQATLSSFTGEATATLPPPKQTNVIDTFVQVPSNMTVVIGGVVSKSQRKGTEKIPFLGDIPLLGALFSDQNKTDVDTVLYIFLTPRVIRDEKFGDAELISAGPMREVKLDPDLPKMVPVLVDIFEIPPTPPTPPTPPPPSAGEGQTGGDGVKP